jgi:hypothetical protein
LHRGFERGWITEVPVTVSIGGGKAADGSLDRTRARTDEPCIRS